MRESTPAETAAWRRLHLQTRVNQTGVGVDASKRAIGQARQAREQGNLPEAARHLGYAAGERGIAFRQGALTRELGAQYGMPVPPRTSTAPGPVQGDTPVNKSRGRRSWMPGKGLG